MTTAIIIAAWLFTSFLLFLYTIFKIIKKDKQKLDMLEQSDSAFFIFITFSYFYKFRYISVQFLSPLMLVLSFILTIYLQSFFESLIWLFGSCLISYSIVKVIMYYKSEIKGGARTFKESNFLFNANIGNYRIVQNHIQKGIDINCIGINGNTALHLAADQGHIEIVKLLLENGAEINIGDLNNSTPIFNAIRNINLEVVKYLISKGASLDVNDIYKCTPLLASVYANRSNEMIKLLIDSGSNVNYQNPIDGQTSLMVASHFNNKEIRNLLLMKGADIHATDINGLTVYDYEKL